MESDLQSPLQANGNLALHANRIIQPPVILEPVQIINCSVWSLNFVHKRSIHVLLAHSDQMQMVECVGLSFAHCNKVVEWNKKAEGWVDSCTLCDDG